MTIVFLDTRTVGQVPNLHLLEAFGNLVLHDITFPDETIARSKNASIIITNKVIINKEVMDACPDLRLICIAATGMNNVDLDYAKEKGIAVKNVSGYSTNSVAQVTFGMILALMNKTSYFDTYVKSGQYANNPIFTHIGDGFGELTDKTFGIIGMGNIGQRVARIAEAFGARVIYYSTSGRNTGQPYTCVTLDELLETSHIVSIHAPLSDKTKNLIGTEQLKKMKKDAILINAGRGGIVDEASLKEALDNGEISGAGIDVFEKEPIDPDSPLLKIKEPGRIILQPHIAWASIEARTLLVEKIAENIREFLN